MRNRFGLVIAFTAVFFITSVATQAANSNAKSAVGTWKINLQKSKFTNLPAPLSEQLIVTQDDQNGLKWELMAATGDGKTMHESYAGPTDGSYHTVTGATPESMIAYTRNQSGGVDWVLKDTSGNVIEKGSGAVSADGRTLTLKGTLRTANGESSFHSVYDKVK